MRNLTITLFIALSAIALNSCGSSKKIAYLQPVVGDTIPRQILTSQQHEAVIMPDDVVSIIVSSIDPAAAMPFNLTMTSVNNLSQSNNQNTMQGYLVDIDGNIDMPILGTVKIGGLKKSEVINLVKEKLAPYLKEPVVTVRFMNYKVSILGEVVRPGSFSISNERINLLEALSLAGDLTIYGKRENVLVIREKEDGEKEYVRINLTSDEVFRSPFFYLQQNDLVYVEPNKTKIMQASYARQNLPFFISTVSGLASVTALIIALTNK